MPWRAWVAVAVVDLVTRAAAADRCCCDDDCSVDYPCQHHFVPMQLHFLIDSSWMDPVAIVATLNDGCISTVPMATFVGGVLCVCLRGRRGYICDTIGS